MGATGFIDRVPAIPRADVFIDTAPATQNKADVFIDTVPASQKRSEDIPNDDVVNKRTKMTMVEGTTTSHIIQDDGFHAPLDATSSLNPTSLSIREANERASYARAVAEKEIAKIQAEERASHARTIADREIVLSLIHI